MSYMLPTRSLINNPPSFSRCRQNSVLGWGLIHTTVHNSNIFEYIKFIFIRKCCCQWICLPRLAFTPRSTLDMNPCGSPVAKHLTFPTFEGRERTKSPKQRKQPLQMATLDIRKVPLCLSSRMIKMHVSWSKTGEILGLVILQMTNQIRKNRTELPENTGETP